MTPLTELEQDALAEIFNVGVGIATASLHAMTGQHVPVSVPEVEMTSLRHARHHFRHREQRPLCAIRQTYVGDFATDAILMFPEEHQLHLTRMMVGDELPDAELPDVAQDALGELGNIVLNAVISNLASSLHMALEGSIPVVEFLTADEILVHRSTGDAVDDEAAPVLTLMIDFELSAQRVGGYLAFLLDSDSSQTLLRHLGAYIQGN